MKTRILLSLHCTLFPMYMSAQDISGSEELNLSDAQDVTRNILTTVTYTYDACGNRISMAGLYSNTQSSTQNADGEENETTRSTSDDDTMLIGNKRVAVGSASSDGVSTIALSSWGSGDTGTICAYTLAGQLIATKEIHSVMTDISLNSYPTGRYLISVTINGDSHTWKVSRK